MERQEQLEERDERIARREENFSGDKSEIWSAVCGIALLGVAALIIVTLPDIKRYIKMSGM
jgi:hypothetical protein